MIDYRHCLRQLRSPISSQEAHTIDYMIVRSQCLRCYCIVVWKRRYPIKYCIRGSLSDIGFGIEAQQTILVSYDNCLERLLSRQWVPLALGVVQTCATQPPYPVADYFESYRQTYHQLVEIRNYQNQIDSVVFGHSCLYLDPSLSTRLWNNRKTILVQFWRKRKMQEELLYLPPFYNKKGMQLFPGGSKYQGTESSFRDALNSLIAE